MHTKALANSYLPSDLPAIIIDPILLATKFPHCRTFAISSCETLQVPIRIFLVSTRVNAEKVFKSKIYNGFRNESFVGRLRRILPRWSTLSISQSI